MINKIRTTMKLGQVLLGYRKKQRLSQTEVGEKAGLLQKTVSALEKQPDTSKIENLLKLINALDLEIMIRERGTPEQPDDNIEW